MFKEHGSNSKGILSLVTYSHSGTQVCSFPRPIVSSGDNPDASSRCQAYSRISPKRVELLFSDPESEVLSIELWRLSISTGSWFRHPTKSRSVTVLFTQPCSKSALRRTLQLKLRKRYCRDSNTDCIAAGRISNPLRYLYATIPNSVSLYISLLDPYSSALRSLL